MRVAIIGSGIAGLTAAHLLAGQHQVTVFEKNSRLGGHTATVLARDRPIDTGFIVFNDRTYPNFMRLLGKLGVRYRPAPMSFSVSDGGDFEFSGRNLNSYFASRRLLLDPAHYQMLAQMARFNRAVKRRWRRGEIPSETRLGDVLQQYSPRLAAAYALPMTAAIWSSTTAAAADMPLDFFAEFCCNHGLLDWWNRPQWYVIEGGSASYLKPLTKTFASDIRLAAPVRKIVRGTNTVTIYLNDGSAEFDHVIMACHADEALDLLAAPSPLEAQILAALPFSANRVQLHVDASALPRRRRAWAAWNFRQGDGAPRLTYNMNILQGFASPETFCVSLNWPQLPPEQVLGDFNYSHPQYTRASVAAAGRWQEINNQDRISYCGAYWLNGFHEDGVVSGMRVAAALGGSDLAQ